VNSHNRKSEAGSREFKDALQLIWSVLLHKAIDSAMKDSAHNYRHGCRPVGDILKNKI